MSTFFIFLFLGDENITHRVPVVAKKVLDIFRLYMIVQKHGGYKAVSVTAIKVH